MTEETREDQRIIRMIELARGHAEARHWGTAAVYYEAAFMASQELKTPIQRLACGEACAWKAETANRENMIGSAFDWYRRGLIADPLAEELQDLCLKTIEKAQAQMDRMAQDLRKLKAERNTSDE